MSLLHVVSVCWSCHGFGDTDVVELPDFLLLDGHSMSINLLFVSQAILMIC